MSIPSATQSCVARRMGGGRCRLPTATHHSAPDDGLRAPRVGRSTHPTGVRDTIQICSISLMAYGISAKLDANEYGHLSKSRF